MANKDWAFGIAPLYHKAGGGIHTERWPLRQGLGGTKYATAIYKNAPVQLKWTASTGSYAVICDTTNPGISGTLGVTRTKVPLGVAGEYYIAGTTATTGIAVIPASEHIFVMQTDQTTTGGSVKLLAGQQAALTGMALGNTTNGLSKCKLDFSSASTSAGKAMRILGYYDQIGELPTGGNAKVRVLFQGGIEVADHSTNIVD